MTWQLFIDVKCNYTDITPDVYKTKSAIVLEYKDTRTILEDAKSYNKVNSDTKYQLKDPKNMYGISNGLSIVIKE